MRKTYPSQSPILITGCPRSGTTFCGKIVSASPDVFEVYEPFNHQFRYNLGLPDKFYRLTAANDTLHQDDFEQLTKLASLSHRLGKLPRASVEYFKYKETGKSGDVSALLALKKMTQERASFWPAKRVSFKDPIAFFSSDWIAQEYNSKVVVMVRQPGGVVSSFLSLGWEPETRYIVNHELPVSKGKFDQEIQRWNANPEDIVGSLILQWKIFTQWTLDFQTLYPDWTYVLHDELCLAPQPVFERIFADLSLEMIANVREKISALTSEGNDVNPDQHRQHAHKRASAELLDSWKKRLEPNIIERIQDETNELWTEAVSRFRSIPDLDLIF